MVVNPKEQLHDLIDRLSEDEARRLAASLRPRGGPNGMRQPRPLTEADILLPKPVLAEDETADKMIAMVRRWRREGGCA